MILLIKLFWFYSVRDLDKGQEYEFRVRAKNRAGAGDPSPPTDSVVVKPKPSLSFLNFHLLPLLTCLVINQSQVDRDSKTSCLIISYSIADYE